MFWRKKSVEEKRKKEVRRIEGALWGYMVSKQGVTVDVLQYLRRVECEAEVEGKPVVMIRIFDPIAAKKKGVDIEEYKSLDDHLELVLYEGYYQVAARGATNIHIGKNKK